MRNDLLAQFLVCGCERFVVLSGLLEEVFRGCFILLKLSLRSGIFIEARLQALDLER